MIYYYCADLVTRTKLSMVQVGSLRDLRAQKKHKRCLRQSWEKLLWGSWVSLKFFKAFSKHWNAAKIPIHLVQVVQKVDNTICWLNHYPAYGMVCFVNSIRWKANYLVGSVIKLRTTWHFINQSLQQAIFICLVLDWNYGSLQWRLCDARN